jgi:putative colanic acid biosysnthesis UDP-glucose lipid carrier transferase
MPEHYRKLIKVIYTLGDFLSLNIAFFVAYFIRFKSFYLFLEPPYLYVWAYFNVLWLLIALFVRTYEVFRLENYGDIIKKILRAMAWHFASTTIFIVAFKIENYSRVQLGTSYLLFTFFVLLWRLLIISALRTYRKLGYNYCNVVIIGYGKAGLDLYQFFRNNPDKGYQFMGFFDDKHTDIPLVKGKIQEAEKFILENDVREVFCSLEQINRDQLKKLTLFTENHLRRIKIIPNLKDFTVADLEIEQYGQIPVVLSRKEPLNDLFNQILKRSFDIIFSGLVILFVFSWLFPILAIWIRLDSKGPAFFRQKRNGKNNKVFWCYKFRTMAYQKDAEFVQATKNDSRITKLGTFLRRSNLDEMPQFLNVFMGDMTVVGPRPHPLELNETFKHVVDKYMVRHLVKPGVTGLAQVRGYRGETKDVRSMIGRIKMDVFYIENWTFWLDIKIIIWTLFKTVKGDQNAF